MAEYYEFEENGVFTRLVPSILDSTYNNRTYTATVMKRKQIVLTESIAKSEVVIDFSRLHAYARQRLSETPENIINLSIYNETGLFWKGQFTGVKAGKLTIALTFVPLFTANKRSGFMARLVHTCRHPLYSTPCGVVKAGYAVNYTTTANSRAITVTGLTEPDGYFQQGLAEMEGQLRDIVSQEGEVITLNQAFFGALSGTITLYAGCNLTETHCKDKFLNLSNFGGFSRIPTKNPFSETGLL